jgi:hypothetical protein
MFPWKIWKASCYFLLDFEKVTFSSSAFSLGRSKGQLKQQDGGDACRKLFVTCKCHSVPRTLGHAGIHWCNEARPLGIPIPSHPIHAAATCSWPSDQPFGCPWGWAAFSWKVESSLCCFGVILRGLPWMGISFKTLIHLKIRLDKTRDINKGI